MLLSGQPNGIAKTLIIAVSAKPENNVGRRYLKGDVHASLKVETQPQLGFLDFLIGVLGAQEIVNGFVPDGVEIRLFYRKVNRTVGQGCRLGCLLLDGP